MFTGNPDLGKHMGLRAQRYHSLYNGPIECRLLHFEVEPEALRLQPPRALPPEERGEGAQMLANRLRKNRSTWPNGSDASRSAATDSMTRTYPSMPWRSTSTKGERRWVHVQEYEAPASVDPKRARRRLREALGVIPEVLEVPKDQVFFKVRRQQKGKAQYERLGRAAGISTRFRRDGLQFPGQLRGLSRHRALPRPPRHAALLGELAARQALPQPVRLHRAPPASTRRGGGAVSTTTVDMSSTYLDWARRNLALNGFAGPEHRLIQADCLQLDRAGRGTAGASGSIFLDPPSFSTSKRMTDTLDVQRDHVALIRAALRLLEPDGVLVFSNNLRRFRMDLDALSDLAVENITAATLPKDFSRNPHIHGCWKIRPRQP